MLGPDYAGVNSWSTGMADRLLEQAVAWAADSARRYTVQALADTVILAGRWRHTSEKALATALDLLPPAARAVTSIILSRINMKQQSRFTREDAGAFYHSYKDYYHA